jgi:hypothetical protein
MSCLRVADYYIIDIGYAAEDAGCLAGVVADRRVVKLATVLRCLASVAGFRGLHVGSRRSPHLQDGIGVRFESTWSR